MFRDGRLRMRPDSLTLRVNAPTNQSVGCCPLYHLLGLSSSLSSLGVYGWQAPQTSACYFACAEVNSCPAARSGGYEHAVRALLLRFQQRQDAVPKGQGIDAFHSLQSHPASLHSKSCMHAPVRRAAVERAQRRVHAPHATSQECMHRPIRVYAATPAHTGSLGMNASEGM